MSTVRALVMRDLVRAHPALTALTVAGLVATMACQLAVPAALGTAVTSMAGRGPTGGSLAVLGALVCGALVGSVVASQASAYRTAATTVRYRVKVLDRALGMAALRPSHSAGDLAIRFSTDAETPARIGTALLHAAVSAGGGLVALAALWGIDWRLGLLLTLEMAASAVVVRAFVGRSNDAETRYRTAQGRLAARLVDAYHGMRTIRASGTRDREVRRILAPLADLRAAGVASWRSQRDAMWRMGLVAPACEVALLVVAGLGVVDGRLTAGELIAALVYSQLALGVLEQVDLLLTVVHDATNCRRLLEVLDAPVLPAPPAPRPLPVTGRGEVRFEQVTVAAGVLAGVSFTVPAGAHVAVVGRSGAGKSTLVALPGRLAEADAGRVLVDGVDVRDLDPAELRRAVAYAFEEPRLFGATVASAIAATAALPAGDVERAGRLAQADGFIRRLPRGYATPLERSPMSGGELQRVGLARALARPSRVVVLDDATSSLDTATAAEIGHATRRAWRSRTALVVAHRAATAAGADLVAWLDGGRLRAFAPHRELWPDPAYRAVFAAEGEGAQP